MIEKVKPFTPTCFFCGGTIDLKDSLSARTLKLENLDVRVYAHFEHMNEFEKKLIGYKAETKEK